MNFFMQYSCKNVVLLPIDKRGSCVDRMPKSLLLGMNESADFSNPESSRVGEGEGGGGARDGIRTF
jgi:hypothetical protein